jgi:hypothetical protein
VRPVSYSLPKSPPRSLLQDIRATIVRILAYMGGLCLLAILAVSFFRTETVVAAVESSPHTDWINIDRPHPAFELQMPEWASTNVNYYILRRPRDGGRKDVLTFGDPAANGPYVAFEIYRPGSADERFIDAASEIAARIVAFTVTDDVKAAGQIDTKFGTMSLVDFAIAAGGPSGRRAGNLAEGRVTDHVPSRRCLGFVRPFDAPLMQVSGWYCSPGEEVVDRAVLSCALDRLTMLSAGGDPALAMLFANAEVKRTFCGQRGPILAATPERAMEPPLPRNPKFGALKLRGRLSLR